MLYRILLVASIAFALANGGVAPKNPKLKFSFYTTSLCFDTVRFITLQLHPVYQELQDYLDVEFIPWGKTQRDEAGNRICQFGEPDCDGNTIQSCVLHHIRDDQPTQIDYMNCEMTELGAAQQNYTCANKAGVSTEDAESCFESELGEELQREAEAKTATIVMNFVPTIVFNDVYDEAIQEAAFKNFKRFVCDLLEDENLPTCRQPPKQKLSFYITSLCLDTVRFVTQQLHPVYQELQDYLDVEFIPWGKTQRDEDGNRVCQFGVPDCDGNKIKSCVLHFIGDDQPKQVDYINCEMKNIAAAQQNYTCANVAGVSTEDVEACFESELGEELQREAEAKTATIVMNFVPTIVHNDVYDEAVQEAAFTDFKGFVCDLLADENLPTCYRPPKQKLSFYITSLCYDTVMFVTQQLHPVYQELQDYLDVEFIPWGKTQRDEDGNRVCQFGAPDCDGNKIQSCVLHFIKDDQPNQVDYINCEMTEFAAAQQLYTCANKTGVSTEDVEACFESELGEELQREAEAKTATIVMDFVPTIVHNDVYDEAVQEAAFTDFKGFVCDLLADENLPTCYRPPKQKLSFYITSLCYDTVVFVTQQLHPVYQELKDYLDVEFIPWGKTQRDEDGNRVCQFGAPDCDGNKIQSCVLHFIKDDQPNQVDYINCEMTEFAAAQQLYTCANKTGVSTEDVEACFESELGEELQREAEAKTATIVMDFVPTIVHNDVYDEAVQEAAFTDFKGFVCDLLADKDLPTCRRPEKIKLSFYITSLCIDTIVFVNQQLYSVYQDLQKYLEVEFIPWGKTVRNEEGDRVCQFGDRDCDANKIQSCVLHYLDDDQPKKVDYIDCEMRTLSAVRRNYTCANAVGVSTENAESCFLSELGDQLQIEAEIKTSTIVMTFVPTIVKNDVYNEEFQDSAFADLRDTICNSLGYNVTECLTRNALYNIAAR